MDWSMANDWWLRSALGGGGLLLLAWLLTHCWRQPARRQLVGVWGVAAALLVLVLALAPAWLPVAVPIPAPEPPAPASAPDLDNTLPPAGVAEEPIGEVWLGPLWLDEPATAAPADPPAPRPTPAPAEPAAASIDWLAGCKAAYLLAAGLLLGRWLLGHLALRRRLARCQPAPARIAALFAELAGDRKPAPRLLIETRLALPLCCGLWRPTVVLPADWCEQSEARLRWVFTHELTHLRRGDAWTNCLIGLAQAFYFYLPWFWWVRRQVRLCQEYVADAAAAEVSRAEDYADFLLQLTPARPVRLPATGVLGNTSDLFRRITMLLKNPAPIEKGCPTRWSLTAAGLLLSAAVLLSGVGLRAETLPADDPAPAAGDDKKTDPAPAQEEKKTEPRKEPVPGSNIDEIVKKALEGLPAGVDKDQIEKQIRRALEQAKQMEQRFGGQFPFPGGFPPNRADIHKQMEELRKALEKNQEDFRKRAEEIQKQFGGAGRGFGGVIGRRPTDGRLGVSVVEPNAVLVDQLRLPEKQGLIVEKVAADSAADKAGLQANDILLELGGKPVPSSPREFARQLEEIKANTPVDAVLLRKGKKETIKGITLPESKPRGQLQNFQVNPLAGVPGFQVGPAAGDSVTMTTRHGDQFSTTYQEGGLQIRVVGTLTDGKAKVNGITIQEGGQNSKRYADLKDVPEKYRDRVKGLID